VLAALLSGFYYGSLVAALARAAAAHDGRAVAIQTAGLDAVWEQSRSEPGPPQATAHVGWDHLDGFVCIINAVEPAFLHDLRAAGKPVVIISHSEPGFAAPTVRPDNRAGVTEAVEHLIAHGHERIAFVGNPVHNDIRERHAAYEATLWRHGITPDPALHFHLANNLDAGGRQAAAMLLEAGLPCTAVVAATDFNAFGLIEALTEAGLDLPEQLAVVGFDDVKAAQYMSPALSSVTQNFDQIGAKSVELLIRQLRGEAVEAREYLVPTSYVTRESCGCPGEERRGRPLGVLAGTGAIRSRADLAPTGPDVAPAGAGQAPGYEPELPPAEQLSCDLAQALFDEEPGPEGIAVLAGISRSLIEALRLAAVEGAEPQLRALWHNADELFRLGGSPDVIGGILRSLHDARRRLEQLLRADPAQPETILGSLSERLDECLVQLSQRLAKARHRDNYLLDARMLFSQHRVDDISMDLLQSHEHNPRALSWLSRTKARAGQLAVWPEGQTEGDYRYFDVVGNFDAVAGERSGEIVPAERRRVEAFPGLDLMELAEQGDDLLTFLLPVRTESSNWGYFAIVGPVEEGSTSGREIYFQWAVLLSVALDHERMLASLRSQQRDLVAGYQRERALIDDIRASEERYALAAAAANDGLWDWDLALESVYYSPRFKATLGVDDEADWTSPEEWLCRVHPEDRPTLEDAIAAARAGQADSLEVEHRLGNDGEGWRWATCRALAVPGGKQPATRLVGSLTDITDRKRLEERLRHQALYDGLTGLPNRTLFLDRLSQAISQARRDPSRRFTVLWLDLDGFKVVNDSLGHLIGDLLLVGVAERIKAALREADTAARFGGDEFAILLQDVADLDAVGRVVDRVQRNLAVPYELDGHRVVVTASIGIAASPTGYDDAENVLRDADIAMYQAKSVGRGSSATFDRAMHAGAMSRLETENELRQAIETDQLELHYQPIVELASGRLQALEALVRWRHPERGLIPPGTFLPVAEETNLIIPLGAWVLADTCRQIADWSARGLVSPGLRVSVNVSDREFWQPDFLARLDGTLRDFGIEPEQINLEITEGVIMRDVDRAQDILAHLHQRGIDLHIDDFGTGYSSLQSLHRFEVQALKIDRSFTNRLTTDRKSLELIRTMILMGANLGLDVIAEGVETEEQQLTLRNLHCPSAQGYWLSRPLPASHLEGLLQAPTITPSRPDALATGLSGR
jgi:diguanylate cyclase (GGDEF)-like protein